jgi:hypothetical protein
MVELLGQDQHRFLEGSRVYPRSMKPSDNYLILGERLWAQTHGWSAYSQLPASRLIGLSFLIAQQQIQCIQSRRKPIVNPCELCGCGLAGRS